jgi:hypothetical protein
MTTAKWTEERTAQLTSIVGAPGSTVSKEAVEAAANQLETTVRSIAAKLRKLGYSVASLAKETAPTFTEEEAAQLKSFVESNSGNFTYAQVAENFNGGQFSAKQIQGKVLSLELTKHIKPAEKLEVARTYSEQEEAAFVQMANNGAYLEDIAAKLGKSLASVRGKALSMLRSGEIAKIPAQKESHADPEKSKDVFEGVEVGSMTVAELVTATGKTERGIRTMLTKRGLSAKDYDGAAKKAKAEEKRAA